MFQVLVWRIKKKQLGEIIEFPSPGRYALSAHEFPATCLYMGNHEQSIPWKENKYIIMPVIRLLDSASEGCVESLRLPFAASCAITKNLSRAH